MMNLTTLWQGAHDALSPGGPAAAAVDGLWKFLWITAAVVYILVLAAFIYSALRKRRDTAGATTESGARLAVMIATGVTVLILFAFLIVDFGTGRKLSAAEPDALVIDVTGHQWWWEVTYPSADPSLQVTTANEIHIPVGRPVVVRLHTADVIHSFWVPSLAGKRDLIPGYPGRIRFQAASAGIYRGECAEFCGHEHAKMSFLVIAEPADSFAAWLAGEHGPAAAPATESARRGEAVFLEGRCVMCHTIRGTPAGSRVGPDLTHLAARQTLAAGTIPNRRGWLAGFIMNPQRIKPGVLMPPNQLSPADLHALLDYLGSLR